MNKIQKYINNASINRFRLIIQLVSFALLIYGGYLAINLGDRLPTFACVFVDSRGGSCYLLGFQHQMAAPYGRLFSAAGIGVLIGLFTFIGFFLVFNKAWCGFVCPLGTIQDLITKLRGTTSIRYSTYSASTFSRLGKIKFILLILLILLPMAIGNSIAGLPKLSHDMAIPFCMICPGRIVLPLFNGDPSQLMVDFSSTSKMILSSLGLVILGVFLTGSFVKKRFICLFCPMSAFHYLFSRLSLLRLVKEGEKCTRCGNCYRACDVGIREIADDLKSVNIVKQDCMMCFKCVEACPEDHCLQVSFCGKTIYQSTAEGFFARKKGK